MEQQTAVEWLLNWMGNNQYFIGNDLLKAIEQAKEMEKQHIEDAYKNGWNAGDFGVDCWEEIYYNEKFKTK